MTFSALPDGMHANIPAADYHARELGFVSRGALQILDRSPAHYAAWVRGEIADESTPALEFGTAYHYAVLEPDEYARRYVVQPKFGDLRYKGPKAAKASWLEEVGDLEGRTLISGEDDAAVQKMRDSVLLHPIAGRIVEGKIEHTALWRDLLTGLRCKARPDVYIEKLGAGVDVKSAADASPDGFRRAVFAHGYHLQRAHYSAGLRAVGCDVRSFLFVVTEKTPPYVTAVHMLDDRGAEIGDRNVRRLMDRMAGCVKTGEWPGYGSGILTIETPPWAA